jgi:hypothetical protein|tara:strand:- start:25403 stop:25687 length:285 start_codon:yes stop_codon:yes gene_type:complete
MIGCHMQTLRRWRKTGEGPQARRIGGRYYYDTSEVRAFVGEKNVNEEFAEDTATHLAQIAVSQAGAEAPEALRYLRTAAALVNNLCATAHAEAA